MEIQAETIGIEHLLTHSSWVRRLSGVLVGEGPEAEDVAQEAWLSALNSPPRQVGSQRAWLTSVVRNVVRQRRRRHARRKGREERAEVRREGEPSPEELAERVETQRQLAVQVLLLPEPMRQTLLLRYYEDLNSTEIGNRMKVPAATVRWRVARGLELLRSALDAEFGDRKTWSVLLAPLSSVDVPALTGSKLGLASALQVGLAMSLAPKLLVPLAVLVGLVVVRNLTRSDGVSAVTESDRIPVDVPAVVAGAPESKRVPRAKVPVASARQDGYAQPPAAVQGFGTLDIVLINHSTRQPVGGCFVQVAKDGPHPLSESAPAADLLSEPSLNTDASGRVRLHLEAGQAMRVTCGEKPMFGIEGDKQVLKSGAFEPHTQRIASLGAGEERELRIELEPIEFWGIALDRASRRPIRDVRVFRSIREPAPAAGKEQGLAWEGDGRFHFQLATVGGGVHWATAPGLAPVPFSSEPGLGTPDEPVELKLDPAVQLRVQVRDDLGPVNGARVRLLHEFWLGQRWGGQSADSDLRRVTDENGECTFAQLMPFVPYEVSVRPEGMVRAVDLDELIFQPGDAIRKTYSLSTLTTLNGRLVDDDGVPIAGREIWLQAAPASASGDLIDGYFVPYRQMVVHSKTRTDTGGRFLFDEVPAGSWKVGPGPDGTAGRRAKKSKTSDAKQPEQDCPAIARRIEIEGDQPSMEVEIQVPRGLFIEGRVLGLDGAGVGSVRLTAHRPGSDGGFVTTTTDETGAFRLAPLLPGEHKLDANTGLASAEGRGPEPSFHSTGDHDVVLRLVPACNLACELLGVDPDVPRRIEASIFLDGGIGITVTSGDYKDGHYSWSDLEPGSWSILATDSLGTVWVSRSNQLTPGVDLPPIRLQPNPSGTLELENQTGEGLTAMAHQDGARLGFTGMAAGARKTLVLPTGQTQVQWVDREGVEHRKAAIVREGQETTLILEPSPAAARARK